MAEDDEKFGVSPDKPALNPNPWKQVRRFLVFQVKLYADAFRDFLLSFLSIPAFVIDLITGKEGEDSHMEKILALGRKTEKAINLFEQHSPEEQEGANVDSIIDQLEEKVRAETASFRNNKK